MLRQIRLLSKIQLCNLFGMNEIRHTKDTKKKGRFVVMAVIWAFLIVFLGLYITAASVALVMFNVAEVIPLFLYAITSMIIFCFTFLKAGSIIFQMKSYELLVSYPVSNAAIVISRFCSMYVTNLLMSLIVLLPGMIVYGVNQGTGLLFIINVLIGIVALPMLPITLATAVGALITAISSRMRHKSMVSSFLTIVLAGAIIIGTTVMPSSTDHIDIEAVHNLTDKLTTQIGGLYRPAAWFGESVVDHSISSMLLLVGVSLLVFIVLISVLQRYFLKICMALNATSAKNNYKMQQLHTNSIVTALWKKELKRYLASSVWVTNTLIGYVLMAAFGIALCVMGPEKLEASMEIPHIIESTFPIMLGLIGNIMPTTSSAISMEGNNWWIAQTLPIRMKDIIWSKVLVNLTVAAPFYLVGAIAGCIALKPGLVGCIWIFLIPAAFTVLAAMVGITLNLMLPVMTWENETRVVKQSAASMMTLVVVAVIAAVTMAPVILLQSVQISFRFCIVVAVDLIVAYVLFVYNSRIRVQTIR